MSNVDPNQEIQKLIDELSSDNSHIVRKAAQRLGEIGSFSAVDALITVLLGDNWVTVDAAIALGKIGDNKAVEALTQTLHSDKLRAFEHDAIEKATSSGDWRGAIAIAEHIGEDISALRIESARALGQIGDKQAVPDLLVTIRDYSDGDVQAAAYEALSQLHAVEAIPSLIEMLADQTPIKSSDPQPTCNYAAKTLEQLGTPEALAAVSAWRMNPSKPSMDQ
jgi:HEAT repeat protein